MDVEPSHKHIQLHRDSDDAYFSDDDHEEVATVKSIAVRDRKDTFGQQHRSIKLKVSDYQMLEQLHRAIRMNPNDQNAR
jgi:hypothetical protein